MEMKITPRPRERVRQRSQRSGSTVVRFAASTARNDTRSCSRRARSPDRTAGPPAATAPRRSGSVHRLCNRRRPAPDLTTRELARGCATKQSTTSSILDQSPASSSVRVRWSVSQLRSAGAARTERRSAPANYLAGGQNRAFCNSRSQSASKQRNPNQVGGAREDRTPDLYNAVARSKLYPIDIINIIQGIHTPKHRIVAYDVAPSGATVRHQQASSSVSLRLFRTGSSCTGQPHGLGHWDLRDVRSQKVQRWHATELPQSHCEHDWS